MLESGVHVEPPYCRRHKVLCYASFGCRFEGLKLRCGFAILQDRPSFMTQVLGKGSYHSSCNTLNNRNAHDLVRTFYANGNSRLGGKGNAMHLAPRSRALKFKFENFRGDFDTSHSWNSRKRCARPVTFNQLICVASHANGSRAKREGACGMPRVQS